MTSLYKSVISHSEAIRIPVELPCCHFFFYLQYSLIISLFFMHTYRSIFTSSFVFLIYHKLIYVTEPSSNGILWCIASLENYCHAATLRELLPLMFKDSVEKHTFSITRLGTRVAQPSCITQRKHGLL